MKRNKKVIDISKFENIINYKFKNSNLIKEALTHRSYLNEIKYKEDFKHNERLEFLGDAVLELVITEYLFHKYPKRPEGDLTSFRAALVRTNSLAESAQNIKLGEFLFMSYGEEKSGGRQSEHILANGFEAIIGAIYLDSGYEKAKEFILKNLIYKLDTIVKNRLDIDNKSKLQELSQEQLKQTPKYEVIKEEGPDHMKKFTLKVIIGNKTFGTGTGRNKQEAAQNAAKKALSNWTKNLAKNDISVKISKRD